jgi:hypothetical protein
VFRVYFATKLTYFLYARVSENDAAYKTVTFLEVKMHGKQLHGIVLYLFEEWRVEKWEKLLVRESKVLNTL